MSKYTPGNYLVLLFDRFGAKLRDIDASSVTDGQFKGDDCLSKGEAHSHAVVRVISNSAMREIERYDVKSLRN